MTVVLSVVVVVVVYFVLEPFSILVMASNSDASFKELTSPVYNESLQAHNLLSFKLVKTGERQSHVILLSLCLFAFSPFAPSFAYFIAFGARKEATLHFAPMQVSLVLSGCIATTVDLLFFQRKLNKVERKATLPL